MFPSIRLCGLLGRVVAACAALICLAAPAHADPALWVAKGRTATVYLFGTVHVLPKAITWMDPKIEGALAASTELWTEADVGNLSDAITSIRHYGIAAPGETEKLLPQDYRDRYEKQITQTGVNPVIFQHAQPWLAEILLSTSAMARAGANQMGVDLTLLAYARDHKLLTPTFETMDQQFAMLADLPQEAQIASLEDAIDEFDQAGPIYSQLVGAWKSGDEDKLDLLINQTMRAKNEAVWTELILRRNEKFAERISDRLQGEGVAFVAVGAGHLCGSDGVPALLQRRGFVVTRIN
jgi:uncharacterized protein YbaP (TraB family)